MYIVIGSANGCDDKYVGTFKSWDAAQDWIDRDKQSIFTWRITTINAP